MAENIVKVTFGKKGQKGSKTVSIDFDDLTVKMAGMKKFIPVGKVFGTMSKGEARKLRKSFRNNGFPVLAMAQRVA